MKHIKLHEKWVLSAYNEEYETNPFKSIIENPSRDINFMKWFGDSKVVDDKGNPLVVYHGTDRDFTIFSNQLQFFSTDIDFAKEYGDNIIPVYLRIEKPFDVTVKKDFDKLLNKISEVIDPYDDVIYKSFTEYANSGAANDSWWVVEKYYQEIKRLGYDGAIIYEGGSTVNYFTYSPTQIKPRGEI